MNQPIYLKHIFPHENENELIGIIQNLYLKARISHNSDILKFSSNSTLNSISDFTSSTDSTSTDSTSTDSTSTDSTSTDSTSTDFTSSTDSTSTDSTSTSSSITTPHTAITTTKIRPTHPFRYQYIIINLFNRKLALFKMVKNKSKSTSLYTKHKKNEDVMTFQRLARYIFTKKYDIPFYFRKIYISFAEDNFFYIPLFNELAYYNSDLRTFITNIFYDIFAGQYIVYTKNNIKISLHDLIITENDVKNNHTSYDKILSILRKQSRKLNDILIEHIPAELVNIVFKYYFINHKLI